jgi:hypothetical protein
MRHSIRHDSPIARSRRHNRDCLHSFPFLASALSFHQHHRGRSLDVHIQANRPVTTASHHWPDSIEFLLSLTGLRTSTQFRADSSRRRPSLSEASKTFSLNPRVLLSRRYTRMPSDPRLQPRVVCMAIPSSQTGHLIVSRFKLSVRSGRDLRVQSSCFAMFARDILLVVCPVSILFGVQCVSCPRCCRHRRRSLQLPGATAWQAGGRIESSRVAPRVPLRRCVESTRSCIADSTSTIGERNKTTRPHLVGTRHCWTSPTAHDEDGPPAGRRVTRAAR